jgi:mevalonate kinase
LFKASAPGSLMFLGEYAVLHGQHALACAIDKRIYVTVTPRDDNKIMLDSALGHYETTLSRLENVAPFQFVLTTLRSLKKYLHSGCDIKIESEFSATVGFASSAAVTVATLKALSEWLQLSFSSAQLIQCARKIIRTVQGTGSGADAAACVLGGLVLYRMQPFVAKKFSYSYPITVVYSGSKTPTPVAIKHVQEKFSAFPDIFSKLMKAINECTLQGVAAFTQQDWKRLGNVMTIQQGLMDTLGVNTVELDDIIKLLRKQPNLLGAKISGSGLGDCVVALGECVLDASVKQIKVNMTMEGVRCEKI